MVSHFLMTQSIDFSSGYITWHVYKKSFSWKKFHPKMIQTSRGLSFFFHFLYHIWQNHTYHSITKEHKQNLTHIRTLQHPNPKVRESAFLFERFSLSQSTIHDSIFHFHNFFFQHSWFYVFSYHLRTLKVFFSIWNQKFMKLVRERRIWLFFE